MKPMTAETIYTVNNVSKLKFPSIIKYIKIVLKNKTKLLFYFKLDVFSTFSYLHKLVASCYIYVSNQRNK